MTDAPQRERKKKRTSRRLGRYRLSYELASGGMATVYMACTEGVASFDKVVALKKIHPHLARQQAYVDMFMDEARLASRIQHPNVCSVIDFGEADDAYFLVMEYLVGVPLNKLIANLAKERSRPSERWPAIASYLIAQAADGLHAAHELRGADGELLGVVHRDVSPHNLFVGFDGQLRVVDFGIAKAADKIHQTATGEVKGKFSYMPPEQIRQAEIDRRVDVWALGVVLWEMLTLRRLFRRGNDAESMYAVLEAPVPPPSSMAKGIPPELDALVLRALERDVDARLPDAREMGRELRRIGARAKGDPVDSAEVTEFLRELMPGEEERQRSLVELARNDEDSVPRVSQGGGSTDSFSNLTGSLERPTRPEGAAATARPWWASGSFAAVVALVALGAGVAAGTTLMSGPDETPVERAAAGPVDGASDDGSRAPADDDAADDDAADERAADATAAAEDGTGDTAAAEDGSGERSSDEAEPSPSEASPPEPLAAAGAAPVEDEPTATPRAPRRRTTSRRRRPPPGERTEPAAAAPAPTPPPSTPSPAPRTGRVAVVTPGGWANVYDARGRFLGPTPLSRELPAGRHRLELRFNGEPPPVPVEVEVVGGETVRVSRRPP